MREMPPPRYIADGVDTAVAEGLEVGANLDARHRIEGNACRLQPKVLHIWRSACGNKKVAAFDPARASLDPDHSGGSAHSRNLGVFLPRPLPDQNLR